MSNYALREPVDVPEFQFEKEPMKLRLLNINSVNRSAIREITTQAIFDKSNVSFHPDGLYSTEIFGDVGSKDRDSTFAFIDLKIPIIHPAVYKTLVDLKGLYGAIATGKKSAIWDEEEKNFKVPRTQIEKGAAQTGYEFFFSKWKDIVHKQSKSPERAKKIEFVEKYKETADLNKWIVMPAGFRDMEIIPPARRKDNEINDIYRSIMSAANNITPTKSNLEVYDVPRAAMQREICNIYEYITKILSGKGGWIQKKFASRNTVNGTRNVVTAMNTATHYLGSESNASLKDTQMPFIQCLRGAYPFTMRGLKTGILSEVFTGANETFLVDTKTLKLSMVDLGNDSLDKYTTIEGLNKLIKKFNQRSLRNKPILIENHYLALVYEDEESFKVIRSIDDLPEGKDKANVTPMTLADLLFISTIDVYEKLCGTMTRYPVTEDGSIYPTFYKVRSTIAAKPKYRLNDEWEKEKLVTNFHKRSLNAIWLDSLQPHLSRLDGAGADFDGDQFSSPILYSRNAYNEITKYFKSRKAYVSSNGSFLASAGNKTGKLVIANLTKDAKLERYQNEQKPFNPSLFVRGS